MMTAKTKSQANLELQVAARKTYDELLFAMMQDIIDKKQIRAYDGRKLRDSLTVYLEFLGSAGYGTTSQEEYGESKD